MDSVEPHFYYPPALFPEHGTEQKHDDWVLLILNTPNLRADYLAASFKTCSYSICADGGANRLFDIFTPQQSDDPAKSSLYPDVIHGDLDSVRQDVREFYASQGVAVSKDGDQYSTDFAKAMGKISEYICAKRAATPSKSVASVLAFGTIAGRVDHGLGLLGEMIREETRRSDAKIYLVGDCNLSFLLQPGENVVDFSGIDQGSKTSSKPAPFIQGIFTRNVGIVPIAGPAVISTKGFEWDVQDWETSMGGNISTSNHLIDNVIRVWTDRMVLFTVEMSRNALSTGFDNG